MLRTNRVETNHEQTDPANGWLHSEEWLHEVRAASPLGEHSYGPPPDFGGSLWINSNLDLNVMTAAADVFHNERVTRRSPLWSSLNQRDIAWRRWLPIDHRP